MRRASKKREEPEFEIKRLTAAPTGERIRSTRDSDSDESSPRRCVFVASVLCTVGRMYQKADEIRLNRFLAQSMALPNILTKAINGVVESSAEHFLALPMYCLGSSDKLFKSMLTNWNNIYAPGIIPDCPIILV